MYDIFFSYSTKDRDRLQPLVRALEQQNWRVFWDHQEVHAGDNWSDRIEAELMSSGCVVVAWSNHATQSTWVKAEARRAVKRGVFIPLCLDVVDIPLEFEPYQAIPFTGWNGNSQHPAFEKLIKEIRTRLNNRQQEISHQNQAIELTEKAKKLAEKEAELAVKERATSEAHARADAREAELARQQAALQTPSPPFAPPIPRSNWYPQIGIGLAVLASVSTLWFKGEKPAETPPAPAVVEAHAADTASAPPAAPAVVTRQPYEPEMVRIPQGSFVMGCQDGRDKDCDSDEKSVRPVQVRAFQLGKTEVTVGQFRAFVEATHYQTTAEKQGSCRIWTGSTWEDGKGNSWRKLGFSQTDNDPVACVSWDDSQAMIAWLNKTAGGGYRLPSESEWEYACRAGQDTNYCGGNDVNAVAWYDGNSGNKTHPVGGKQANALGLYDMSGNVWEWVQDSYHSDYKGAPSNGDAWEDNAPVGRVLRGGSWFVNAGFSRAADRSNISPAFRDSIVGFRLARTPQ